MRKPFGIDPTGNNAINKIIGIIMIVGVLGIIIKLIWSALQ